MQSADNNIIVTVMNVTGIPKRLIFLLSKILFKQVINPKFYYKIMQNVCCSKKTESKLIYMIKPFFKSSSFSFIL